MFSNITSNDYIQLTGDYDLSVVILSVVIACFASYTAISLNDRIQHNGFFNRNVWLLLASVSMGFGIWAMHFVAMSAFSLPIQMHFDNLLTVVSVIPAILASFLAFYLANRPGRSVMMYILSGVAMGIGIASMHYLGMASMKMEVMFVYDPSLFVTSIFIAIIVSFVAIYIFSSLQQYMKNIFVRLVTSIFMGLAVASMHYTGMAGTSFYIARDTFIDLNHDHHMNVTFLITGVTIGIGLLMCLLLLSSLLERYIDFRVKFYDIRTDLPNRRQFEKNLYQASTSKNLAIWHFDNLENIINEYGYDCGEKFIDYVATRLKQVKLPQTSLYRVEENRFAFLMQRNDQIDELQRAMEIIALEWQDQLNIDGKAIKMEAACALSQMKERDDPKNLYAHALVVLTHPSIRYTGEVVLYDPSLHTYSFEQELVDGVDRAMEQHEFFVVYQPKIGLDNRAVLGFEALIRWQHPEHGLLSPAVFIPVLEKSDRIFDVTDWIIEEVCKQIAHWKAQGKSEWHVAINIPGEYVSSPRLLHVLENMLQHYQLDPSYIELEMTERSFVKSIHTAMDAISRIRDAGFTVALDDFGTGVSSLSYLRQMSISTLKIDKTFVDSVLESEKDASILKAIIDLGQSLNLLVVIEGIETEQQVEYLKQATSSLILQGFYFAKPMTVREVGEWLDEHEAVTPELMH